MDEEHSRMLGYGHFPVRLHVHENVTEKHFKELKCWYDRLINCISDILTGVPWVGCARSGLPVKCIVSLADAGADPSVWRAHQPEWWAGKFTIRHKMCICWASRHCRCGWSVSVNYDCSHFELLPFESCANKALSALCKNPHAARLV